MALYTKGSYRGRAIPKRWNFGYLVHAIAAELGIDEDHVREVIKDASCPAERHNAAINDGGLGMRTQFDLSDFLFYLDREIDEMVWSIAHGPNDYEWMKRTANMHKDRIRNQRDVKKELANSLENSND